MYKDEQGRVDTRLAICQTDRIAHVLKGLSLGKQLWSTPGTIFIFQKPVYFGSYYFVPVEKSSLYFLLVKDKGAVYLYGQGKVMYKGKLLLNFD